MGQVTLSFKDFDNEATSVSFPTSDLLDTNIASEYTEALALQSAVVGITLGNLVRRTHVALSSPQGVGRSTDPQAQREAKALVSYYDDTTFKIAEVTIPTIDLSLMMDDHPGFFYLDGVSGEDPLITAFVTAFEATVRGPDGNAAVISEIYHIGVST
jgi:hypothetical protein